MLNTEWYTLSTEEPISLCRTGWLGVYDAIVSAITGNIRFTTTRKVYFRVMLKPNDVVCGQHIEIIQDLGE